MGASVEEQGGTGSPGTSSQLKGLKVLVIDDSKTIRRTAETLLAKEGCEVFTAVDLEQRDRVSGGQRGD